MEISNVDTIKKNGFKTLIVEDNRSFRQTLRDSLQTLFPSMVIQEAEDGRTALQKVDTFHPQLIFMDIQLPGENGLSLTQKIKATYPNIKIIVLTSHSAPDYQEAALKLGANGFIQKNSLTWKQIELLIKSMKPNSISN
jgi:DNA-binding NarL/FixJ family response regulator